MSRASQKRIGIVLLVIATLTVAILACFCVLYSFNGAAMQLLYALDAAEVSEDEADAVVYAYQKADAKQLPSTEAYRAERTVRNAVRLVGAVCDTLPQSRVAVGVQAFFTKKELSPPQIVQLLAKYNTAPWMKRAQILKDAMDIGDNQLKYRRAAADLQPSEAEVLTDAVYALRTFLSQQSLKYDKVVSELFRGFRADDFFAAVSVRSLGRAANLLGAAYDIVPNSTATLLALSKTGLMPSGIAAFAQLNTCAKQVFTLLEHWSEADNVALMRYFPDPERTICVLSARALQDATLNQALPAMRTELNQLADLVYKQNGTLLGNQMLDDIQAFAILNPDQLSNADKMRLKNFISTATDLAAKTIEYVQKTA